MTGLNLCLGLLCVYLLNKSLSNQFLPRLVCCKMLVKLYLSVKNNGFHSEIHHSGLKWRRRGGVWVKSKTILVTDARSETNRDLHFSRAHICICVQIQKQICVYTYKYLYENANICREIQIQNNISHRCLSWDQLWFAFRSGAHLLPSHPSIIKVTFLYCHCICFED